MSEAVAAVADTGSTPVDAPINDAAVETQDLDTDVNVDDSSDVAENDNTGPSKVKVKAPGQAGLPEYFDAKNLGDYGNIVVKGVPVNGEEVDLPLSKVIENGRLGKAAFKKFDEAKALREEAENKVGQVRELIQGARKSPLSFVKRLGPEAVEALYSELHAEFQRQALPEADRKALDVEERAKALEERERRLQQMEAEREKAIQEQAITVKAAEYREQILGEMRQVMDGAKFPANERLRAKCVEGMAAYLREANRSGAPMTTQDAFELAYQDLREIVGGIAGSSDAESLASLLGEQSVAALRKRELERARTGGQPQQPQAPAQAKPARRAPAPKAPIKPLDQMNQREWFEYLNGTSRAG
jgi:hypothetical protein